MRLAILHYHLNPGGVTRVIANQLLALDSVLASDESLDVLVGCDGQLSGWPRELSDRLKRVRITHAAVSDLGYASAGDPEPAGLTEQLRAVLRKHGCDPRSTVIHAHNHLLGKNPSYPGALRRLASDGYPLLLQVHDFAEDFRPENYRLLRDSLGAERLPNDTWFQASHVHFGLLNRRDLTVMRSAGVPRERLHFLPNPVLEQGEQASRKDARAALTSGWSVSDDERYVLYPVRGIRRKNIGEMLLLSVLMNATDSPPARLALTLAPLNPAAMPNYRRWTTLADELRLNCLFDTGGEGGLTFAENLAAADVILTTSVAEGFGMVFLESWLTGCPLVGRNLPEITADFVESGLRLDSLYDRLNVPIEWVGRASVIEALERASHETYADYAFPSPDRAAIEEAVNQMTVDGAIDFGRLDESLQEQIIRRVASDQDGQDELRRLNPALDGWHVVDNSVIAANQSAVREKYSLSSSGERLRSIYQTLISIERGDFQQPADAGQILSAFLDLDRFHLIRT